MGRGEGTVTLSTGAHNKFANPARGIRLRQRSLRGKSLVVVIVPAHHHVRIRVVQRLPNRHDFRIVAVRTARAEQGLVKVGQRTRDRVRGQIGAQPLFFRGARVATADVDAFAVEDDDVPRAEFVAVVAGLGISGGLAEVGEIVGRALGVEFVIARGTAGCAILTRPQVRS